MHTCKVGGACSCGGESLPARLCLHDGGVPCEPRARLNAWCWLGVQHNAHPCQGEAVPRFSGRTLAFSCRGGSPLAPVELCLLNAWPGVQGSMRMRLAGASSSRGRGTCMAGRVGWTPCTASARHWTKTLRGNADLSSPLRPLSASKLDLAHVTGMSLNFLLGVYDFEPDRFAAEWQQGCCAVWPGCAWMQ